jgi:CRP-like cAMP-binding protein
MPDPWPHTSVPGKHRANKNSSIFSGLGTTELFQIASYSERILLPKGQILFREGDPVIGFHIVFKGCIKAYRIDEAGREQVIRNFAKRVAPWMTLLGATSR